MNTPIAQHHTSDDDTGMATKPKRSHVVLYATIVTGLLYVGLTTLGVVFGMSPFPHVTGQDETMGAMSIFWLICMQLLVCAIGGYLVGRFGRRTRDDQDEAQRASDRSNVTLVWGAAALMTVMAISDGTRALFSDVVGFGSGAASAAALQGAQAVALQSHAALSGLAAAPLDFAAPDAVIWTAVALVLSAIAASYCATFGALQRDGMKLDLRKRELRRLDMLKR
jgi:hypothetical protein